jgi:hypothetical protein
MVKIRAPCSKATSFAWHVFEQLLAATAGAPPRIQVARLQSGRHKAGGERLESRSREAGGHCHLASALKYSTSTSKGSYVTATGHVAEPSNRPGRAAAGRRSGAAVRCRGAGCAWEAGQMGQRGQGCSPGHAAALPCAAEGCCAGRPAPQPASGRQAESDAASWVQTWRRRGWQ